MKASQVLSDLTVWLVFHDTKLNVILVIVTGAFVNCFKRAWPVLSTVAVILHKQLSNGLLTFHIKRLLSLLISKIGQQRTHAFFQ